MTKTIRAIISLVLSTILILSMNVWNVSAEETLPQPRYNYTGYTSLSLNFTSSGAARCIATAEGYDGITTKIHINMKLQQYIALQWTTIAEWTGTYNDVFGALSKTKTVYTGRYRVKAEFKVYSGSAYEKIEMTTQEKYYTSP